MDFRLGFGPMSREVVEILCNYSHANKKPLMIIASRNQVDADCGYVMTTPQIRAQLKTLPLDYIWMCRDHCGPYFLDTEKNLSLHDAVEATKKTIAKDIEQGVDLIHIDTSRVDNTYKVAEELFKFCLDLNPNIQFEFGTEENAGVAARVLKYKADLAFAKNISNMKFVVAQTGSLCFEDCQVGQFEFDTVCGLVQLANENNVGLKEHNADYLTAEEIQLRKSAGVHALNIAPQLGVIQTKLLRTLAGKYNLNKEWQEFADVVLASTQWKKWTISRHNDQKIIVAGHYCFSSREYQILVDAINKHCTWNIEIATAIYAILDLYTDNI